MGEKEYLFYLDERLENRCRYRHVWERGKMIEFCIQYEALIAGRWHPVVRYDSAHGEPHRDVLRPNGTEIKEGYVGLRPDEVLTNGQRDIIANWPKYRAMYESEMERR
jgi:hypothetical protein